MQPAHTTQRGFTLIELSIVLVVIGLIVGGVLVGQDLIKAASVRKEITQMETLETQINTFYGKYQCLPGDCINATSIFGTTDTAGRTILNGDGNGLIQSQLGAGAPYASGQCFQGAIAGEVTQVFLQLDDAGLANYTADGASNNMGISYPESALGTTGLIVSCLENGGPAPSNIYYAAPQLNSPVNTIVLGVVPNNSITSRILYTTGAANWGENIPVGMPMDVAQRIDQKIDDGLPFTGLFDVFIGSSGYCCANGNTYPPSGASSIGVTTAKILRTAD